MLSVISNAIFRLNKSEKIWKLFELNYLGSSKTIEKISMKIKSYLSFHKSRASGKMLFLLDQTKLESTNFCLFFPLLNLNKQIRPKFPRI